MRTITLILCLIAFGVTSSMADLNENSMNQSNPGITTAIIERTITYQGLLKDSGGNPVPDASYNVTFRLYDLAAGGSALWSSGALSITTSDGYFSKELGPIPLPFDKSYYLSLQVAPDPEMSQRQKVTMAPYSAVSDTANYSFASPGSGSNWNISSNNVLFTNQYWGIARGGAGNTVRGDSAKTMTNLGSFSYAGTFGNQAYCTIGGGLSNAANFSYSTVSGGQANSAQGLGSSVSGGIADSAKGFYSGVSGGYNNQAGSSLDDTAAYVGGGSNNTALGFASCIGGGYQNMADGRMALVAGGSGNTATGNLSAVLGGAYNQAGNQAVTAGGYADTVNGFYSATIGGFSNKIDGLYSFIGGGSDNFIDCNNGTILAGANDTLGASATYSMIIGSGIYCNDDKRVTIFRGSNYGSLNVNRDGRDGYNSYPLQVGTSTSNGNSAYLTSGGVWTNGSSRTFKENFRPMEGKELLSKISNLSIVSYNYRNSTEKHFGPMAEDFVGAFDTGVIRESDGKRDDMYLSSGDVAGVALAGVQELLKKIERLEKEVAELKAQVKQ